MKLKYYLRGLATGLVIATLILTIANRDNKPLTDAQIRQRAVELGMIDSDSRKLSSLQGNEPQAGSSAEPAGSEAQTDSSEAQTDSSEAQTDSNEAQTDSSEAQTDSSEAQTDSSEAQTDSSEAQTDSSEAQTDSSEAQTDSSEAQSGSNSAGEGAVTIYIPGGATSYTVSQDLAAAGLVADAKAYDTFLCDNGYAHTIRVGTYEILPGTSEEEIANMIAR